MADKREAPAEAVVPSPQVDVAQKLFHDKTATREQLLEEVSALRARISELERFLKEQPR